MDKEMLKLIGEAVGDAVNSKMDEIKASVSEVTKGDVKIRGQKEIVEGEKSVMNMKRVKAPFVQLGEKMDKFVSDMKSMIRGAQVLQSEAEKAAFNEGTDADGGYTVPEELEAAILSYVEEEAVVRPRATVIKMASNVWKSGKLDQSSHQFGGVTVSWLGESETASDTKFALTQISLTAKKMLMLTTESREILADSNINFANYVVNIFGRAAAYFEDYMFFNGDGNSQPLGLLADTGIQIHHRAVANQISYTDINTMFYMLKPVFRKRAVWIGSTGAIQYIDGLIDEFGKPLLSESLKSSTPTTLKGKPFIETEKVADLGTKGDLLFIDLGWYYIGDREGITVDASVHDRFRYDEITIRFVKRVDGALAMGVAGVILDVPSVS
ncbi:MAG TPA: phage major capsid protein [Candidatus Moranbacteria bacterium]|nr:phage major capsid protein [Candidatus Moranbacteria bacterium]